MSHISSTYFPATYSCLASPASHVRASQRISYIFYTFTVCVVHLFSGNTAARISSTNFFVHMCVSYLKVFHIYIRIYIYTYPLPISSPQATQQCIYPPQIFRIYVCFIFKSVSYIHVSIYIRIPSPSPLLRQHSSADILHRFSRIYMCHTFKGVSYIHMSRKSSAHFPSTYSYVAPLCTTCMCVVRPNASRFSSTHFECMLGFSPQTTQQRAYFPQFFPPHIHVWLPYT